MRKLDSRQLAREKAVFRYSSALERADFGTVEAVLLEAEHDPMLAQMIGEINRVYESETLRLGASLNHSSNHQKEMLMTTLALPNRQRTAYRWLPMTLAAACISVLFIGALMLRPQRSNNSLAAVLTTTTPTHVLAATAIPTDMPATALPPTVVPPAAVSVSAGSATCTSKDAVILSPTSNSVVAGTLHVTGVATAPNFGSYQLEVIGLGTGSKYVVLGGGVQPVVNAGDLGQLDLSSYPPENYGLRLSVFDATKQLQSACLVNFTLARAATIPSVVEAGIADVTAVPVNVLPISGVIVTQTSARTSPATNSALSITLSAGVVIKIDTQSADGKWSHFVLDGGKSGWVLSSTLQLAQAVELQSVQGLVSLTSTLNDQPNDKATVVEVVQTGTAVTVDKTSADGQWKHVTLADGTDGWMSAGLVETPIQGTKGIVSVEQTILYDKPNAGANVIRTLTHNMSLTIIGATDDRRWSNVILPDGTQGWAQTQDLQTENVPQVAQPNLLCWGTIGGTMAQVYSRPVTSGDGIVIGGLQPQTNVYILDTDNQSGNNTAWYYVQSQVDGFQGWVEESALAQHNYCSQPSSPPDQFVVVGTMVPSGTTAATPVPANALLSFSVAGTPVCAAISFDGKDALITNQTDSDATIYTAPLTLNSNAAAVGKFPSKGAATLLNQQDDPKSAGSIGALWYLIMTKGEGDQQVTGWVSANSVTAENGCTAQIGVYNVVPTLVPSGSIPAVVPATSNSMQAAECHVTNTSDQAWVLFAAPLSSNSNATMVGELAAGGQATITLQNYDPRSAEFGALWYLITTIGDKPVIGWISANSVQSSDGCAVVVTNANANLTSVPAQAGDAGGTTEVVPAPAQAGTSSESTEVVPVPAEGNQSAGASTAPVLAAPTGICTVSVQQNDSVPVYSDPSAKGDDSTLVNNLPSNMSATVLYQQVNKDTGAMWYLILAISKEGKEISGWVSSDSVKVVSPCPSVP